jgi:hypothetical protein
MLEVQIFPLVSRLPPPTPASPGTRQNVPAGYGVQEHCLPFTAANALGFLIKSPITFGFCSLDEVAQGAHAFRSPLASQVKDDEPVFYVKDDPDCCFIKNAFTMDVLDDRKKGWIAPKQPGISFFDRPDQLDLFKLHLPYIWRTPAEVDALFLPLINRRGVGLTLLSGLVETDWYASQVNLVFSQPAPGHSAHVAKGDAVAQVIFLERSHRRPTLKVLAEHARLGREMKEQLVAWYRQKEEDRGAYKKLARSEAGRIRE